MTERSQDHPSGASDHDEIAPFETILLPLDGSALSEAAVPYAVALARLTRARLVLLRVLEETAPVFDTAGRDMIPLDENNPRIELQSPAMLAPVIARLSGEGLQPSAVVRLGDPSEEILAEAAQQPHPAIVMTSHGRGGLGRVVTGSVATRVLRHASCPVLIVRPQGQTMPPEPVQLRRLVVPLDGSPLSERALPLAGAIARASGAALQLVRVAETTRDELPRDIASRHLLPYDRETLRRDTRQEDRVRTYLRAVSGRLRRAGLD
ncbi:MAG TPA: universal stress protein, partial [Thermomicrobiaceae bacterium]|nr:universal stress protein [Thermomicrobiaceae bacterium]